MRAHPDQLRFRRTQLIAWANTPAPERANFATVIKAINGLRATAYDTLTPEQTTALTLAIRRLRHVLKARATRPTRSYLPGRRRPGPLDRPLAL